MRRRDFIRVGALGSLGLSMGMPEMLQAQAGGKGSPKSAIFIYLDGGQSHMDSWDPKPDGGDCKGEFGSIKTNIPGFHVNELMPHLAKQADKYCVLRGVEDAIGVHGIGMSLVRSGNRPLPSLKYPDIGSVIAKEKTSPKGIPSFVSVPVKRASAAQETPGYLGVAYSSFMVNEKPNDDDFVVRALNPPDGMTAEQFESRIALADQLDTAYRDIDLANQNLAGMNQFYGQAYDILRSPKIRQAFQLGKESSKMREWYGRTDVGQACLLARRMVEVGVRCVTIDFGGWDTHKKNFSDMKDKLMPPWDQALAALLQDLSERGLLDTTLVWSTGEMGRTPKINKDAGRDHWGKAMSMMLAGAGVQGGRVIGKTDKTGAAVTEDGVTPGDVVASALHALDIDHKKEYLISTGRPITIVHDGNVIEKMFS